MALSNVKRTVLGGGLVAIHGTYAHTEGAAPRDRDWETS